MSKNERTFAYRADDELAAAFRQYMAARHDLIVRVHAWEQAHPDELRMAVMRRTYWLGVVGFEVPWKPREGYATPPGLRASDGKYASPYKDRRGDPWRAKLAEIGEPAHVDLRPILKGFGIESMSWLDHYVSWAGWEDFDDFGVFMTAAAAHSENQHLIPIRMSEYWTARETHEAQEADRG